MKLRTHLLALVLAGMAVLASMSTTNASYQDSKSGTITITVSIPEEAPTQVSVQPVVVPPTAEEKATPKSSAVVPPPVTTTTEPLPSPAPPVETVAPESSSVSPSVPTQEGSSDVPTAP